MLLNQQYNLEGKDVYDVNYQMYLIKLGPL